MSLGAKDVEEIMKLLEASRFDRLSLEMDGLKLELVREGAKPRVVSAPAPAAIPAAKPVVASAPEPAAPAVRDGLTVIKSPLLGIFYRAPKPGEPPFVEVGSMVEDETIIGIIEVMKLMNSARAGVCGEVVEIVATNGELVEHGEALIYVRPAA